jgi:hypothetical protein
MGKLGRKKRGRNRGYFYRSGRGWYASVGSHMVPLLFPDSTRIKYKETPPEQVGAAYEQWKQARLVAEQARAEAVVPGTVSVEDVCRVYLAEARVNGAHGTFLGRADTLFDLCYGLPSSLTGPC